MVSFVPNHITPGHRGANTDHAPSVFAFDPQELILLCELGRNPRDLLGAPASESALRICLHDFFLPFKLVDLARFERATSTFAESRSNSPELQVLSIADC